MSTDDPLVKQMADALKGLLLGYDNPSYAETMACAEAAAQARDALQRYQRQLADIDAHRAQVAATCLLGRFHRANLFALRMEMARAVEEAREAGLSASEIDRILNLAPLDRSGRHE